MKTKQKLSGFWERRFESQKQNKPVCIWICPEGAVTEHSYLDCVENVFKEERRRQGKRCDVKCYLKYTAKNDKSAPTELLKKIKETLEKLANEAAGYDSAWIISDRDNWELADLKKIHSWVKEDDRKRYWILSNENIEYWFKLHFQKNSDYQAFKKNYKKKIKNNDFTYEQILYACEKAREKKQKISDLYTQNGSLMYEIVEYIGKEYGLCSEDSRGRVNWISF